MGVLANHVPSIEQLKPGLVEIVEEGGATKQYFRMSDPRSRAAYRKSAFRQTREYPLTYLFPFATVSGGFAVVQPDSQLSINAVEGFALEDFSAEVGRVTFFCDSAWNTNL